ncbi:MAG: glycosyltransferase family 2 protein [Bacteroidaceae bacterium]|jgi:hypothetical protein|uniref:glycosyltransferase n=1 Tax=unclassified Bacteroides TaxID=2646097 RepID=UPI0004E15625|nr:MULTISPECIES: glycosyltransferase family 2 protein [unclassified Bacteroides]MBP3245113.1 glycosyltransferase family 2 protein [Bacteroidaceae bacterium]SDE93485.1 hypothetical protein SAMN05216518_10170 [Bacteroidales bacterium KHT7]MBP5221136.1 glycosyltransferase family 2 protein [Bacteroidaceae bacterium]MBQ1676341.1 glycosyltransferase family 2 protein [Bacteroidaceae bacterium]MBQ3873795.1 glycosyltransferase family 2 protein [Bacteroidaceae bacterium]
MITASIVTYKHKEKDLDDVFTSVANSSISRLYIIDNSGYNENIDNYCKKFKNITYIPSDNLGYGTSHNIAIRKSIELGAKYHVVLNPDVKFGPEVIDELEKYADDNPDVGQIMPKVFYPDGRLQHLCKLSPTPMDLIGKRFLPKRLTRNRLNRFQLKFTGYNKIMNIPYLSGCFMFFNLEILQEIGLFDEKFFMYSEDVDITRRIHRKYRTIFYPNVSIYHVHNAASTRDLKMLRIHIVNMIKYFNKWGWLFDKERKAMNKETLNNLNY